MKIIKTKIPESSLLYPDHKNYNYIDSFEGTINDKENIINIVDIAKAFLKPGPKWIDYLLMIRDKIVSLFGLKTSDNKAETQHPDSYKFIPGERVYLFKVFSKTDDEIILGEDDKHLNFRLSLLLKASKNRKSNKSITATTVVKYNNWFGRLYFIPVKPFHKVIVRATLKNNLQQIESKINS